MSKDKELRYRKFAVGWNRKYGGDIGKIPSEFLPSGEMKIASYSIRPRKPKPLSPEEKDRLKKIMEIENKIQKLEGAEIILGHSENRVKRIQALKEQLESLKRPSPLFTGDTKLKRNGD